MAATAGVFAAAATKTDGALLGKVLAVPIVKPGASWNGNAGSGGTAPTPTSGTSGRGIYRPACRWTVTDRQRAATNFTFGVDADALDGVSSVTFWVEGATYLVTTPRRIPWITANGTISTRYGYWLTLNTAACVSQSPKTPTNGTAGNVLTIYATATPVNSSATAQIIGPLTVYPEATVNSVSKTIGPSGADYTSIYAALNATRIAGWSSPLFTFITTGYYDWQNGAWSNYTGSLGYVTFTAGPGVTATIGRAVLDYSNTQILPDCEYIELRGSGIQLDTRNFTDIVSYVANSTLRLNGCIITTSEGTQNSYYWADGYKKRTAALSAYAEDCQFYWQQIPVSGQNLAINNACYGYAELWSDSSLCCQGNWLQQSSADFFRVQTPAFTVIYTGASATATIAKTGSNNGGTLVLVDSVNGTNTITLGTDPTQSYYLMSDVIAWINTFTGWSATAATPANMIRASYLIGDLDTGFGTTNGFPATSAKNITLSTNTFIDIHTHGWQVFAGGLIENIIFRGNVQMGLSNGYTLMIFDTCPQFQDAVFTDMIYESGGTGIAIKTPCVLSHVVLRNFTCTTLGPSLAVTTGSWSIDQYCIWQQCVFQNIYLSSGAWPTYPALVDSCLPTGQAPVGRSADTGNFVANSPFVNLGAQDFRLTGTPLVNLKTRLEQFDSANNARAATDVIGALATGYPNPSWPVNV